MKLVTSHAIVENYSNYYDQDQFFSDWRRLGAIEKAANIVSLCGHDPLRSVLDVGCGDGAIIERMTAQGHWALSKVVGLEISSSAITVLARKGISAGLFDGYNIPYPDSSFDLVVLSHVLEHVEHPRQLLYEAKRVAKQLFIEVPLEDNRRLSSDFVFDEVGHINFYNQKTIRRLIQSCRLSILAAKLSHASAAVYKFQKGWRGVANYWVKEVLLRSAPNFASRRFTYHYALLASHTDACENPD